MIEGLCECGCGNHTRIAPRTDRNRGHIKGKPMRFLLYHQLPTARPSGEEHHMWKGSDVKYSGLHRWVLRNKVKTNICQDCGVKCEGKRFTEWANVSGEYRRDLDDYVELCPPCHRVFDSGLLRVV